MDIPLHTVVVVTRALAQGVQATKVGTLTGQTAALITFLSLYDGSIVHPVDPVLRDLVMVYHRFPPDYQPIFTRFALATAMHLLGEEQWQSRQSSS
jgi:hypothetical protein